MGKQSFPYISSERLCVYIFRSRYLEIRAYLSRGTTINQDLLSYRAALRKLNLLG